MWTRHVRIKPQSYLRLHELEYQLNCMLFLSILLKKGQSIQMGMKALKTFILPLEAILALMNRCLAFALNMKLLEVACFCEHHQLMWSKIKSVLDSFMLAQLNALLSIFRQYIASCYSSSKVKFLPCRIDLNMVHPKSLYEITRILRPKT